MTIQVKIEDGTTMTFQHKKAIHPFLGVKKYSLVETQEEASDFLRKYGESATLFGGDVFEHFFTTAPKRKGSDSYHTYVRIGKVSLRANQGKLAGRPERPFGYLYPTKGPAGRATERVARALKYGRNIYYYGPPGTGKSDLFRTLAHDLNMEFSLYPMQEALDPALYLGQMAVVVDEKTGVNKTEFVPGRLLQDIQGRVGKDGKRRPVLIVIDDIDRAPPEHNELYRHLLDGAKEVFVPEIGASVPVFPGTQFCATANSRGRGEQGLLASVQTIDDSLLDRFDRFVESHFLDPSEEQSILEKKYPLLKTQAATSFSIIMGTTTTIREMIKNQEVYMNFSHRVLMNWCESLEEILQENNNRYTSDMVGYAAVDWLERFDSDHRSAILERTLSAYLPRKIQQELTSNSF